MREGPAVRVSREPQDDPNVMAGQTRGSCGSDVEGNSFAFDGLSLEEATKRYNLPPGSNWDAVYRAAKASK